MPRERVREREARRVEELAIEAEVAALSVQGIARDGQVDRAEVDADLVRPPGLEPHTEERVARQELDHLEVRHRLARRRRVERMPRRVVTVAADRRIDRAAARARAAE